MKYLGSYMGNIGNLIIKLYQSTNYLQAGLIILLLFLLVITLASVRKHFVHWSLKGGMVGLFFGFLIALIIEGIFLVNGSSLLTSVFGWKSAPKPISTALDLGKEKLTDVLGISTQENGFDNAISILQTLNPDEIIKIRTIICTP